MKYLKHRDGLCAVGATRFANKHPDYQLWDAARLYEYLKGDPNALADIPISPNSHTVAYDGTHVFDYLAQPSVLPIRQWIIFIERYFR